MDLLQPVHPLHRGIVAHKRAKFMQAKQKPSLSHTHTHARTHARTELIGTLLKYPLFAKQLL